MARPHLCNCHHPSTAQYINYEPSAVDNRCYPQPIKQYPGENISVSSDAPVTKPYYQLSNSPASHHDRSSSATMNHYHHQQIASGPPHPPCPNHMYRSENDQHSPNLMAHPGPWHMADFTRPNMPSMTQTSMGPYLPQAPAHSVGGQNFDYNTMSSPSSMFAHSHMMGVLTPDQSPHTATVSVTEERAFPSEPPRAESPPVHEQMERINMALKSSSPVQRPDGVRKKNAKFEIPDGRTIGSIESLLRKAKDDNVIKELKSQKRLLKNREAALQSRARKKAYTEKLEEENKALKDSLEQSVISGHQHAVAPLPPMQQDDGLGTDTNRYVSYIATLKQEIAMMQQQNQQLHRENSVLREQLQTTFDPPASTVLNSTGYANGIDDPENLAFGANHFDFFNDELCINSEPSTGKKEASGETSTVVAPSVPSTSPNTMLTLLMYGAHVASLTSQGDAGTTRIPSLSADDCTASTDLLRAIYSSTSSSARPRRPQNPVKLDLGNLTAANAQAVAEFRSLCDDASHRPSLFVSRDP